MKIWQRYGRLSRSKVVRLPAAAATTIARRRPVDDFKEKISWISSKKSRKRILPKFPNKKVIDDGIRCLPTYLPMNIGMIKMK